ncbi:MAG: FMN-binding protein [Treponema sp.]|jgi:fumarate reductase flavoprotein subunit|nr:FMN-binding protein [Treponema sp.]
MKKKRPRVLEAFLPLFFGSLPLLPMLLGCLGSGFVRETAYVPGVYEGTGLGYRGAVQVHVQISAAGIEDIVIISHKEGAYPGAAAMEELLEEMLETGSTDLDAISGATFSSIGFLEAVEDALGKARLP